MDGDNRKDLVRKFLFYEMRPLSICRTRGGNKRSMVNPAYKHSVCYWCFEKLGLERLAAEAAAMGIASIEIVPPEQWPILKRHGLICP